MKELGFQNKAVSGFQDYSTCLIPVTCQFALYMPNIHIIDIYFHFMNYFKYIVLYIQ